MTPTSHKLEEIHIDLWTTFAIGKNLYQPIP